MSNHRETVQVERYPDHPAVRMNWNHVVKNADVTSAFREITACIDEMDTSVYVVVNLSANPQLPLTATINGALFGPYRDKRLAAWLIIGGNSLARLIERTLKSVTGRSNVYWFDSEDEALAYIHEVELQKVD